MIRRVLKLAVKKSELLKIEILDAKGLLLERQAEIFEQLNCFREKNYLDYVFLNLLSISENRNYFVTSGDWMRNLLESALDVEFDGNIGVKDGLTLRKQIVPILKRELEER